jgi:hypothetical protein
VFTARYEFNLCIQIHGGRSPPFHRGARLRSQVSPYEISGGQRDTGAGFFPEYFGFPLSVSFPPILHTHLTYTSLLPEGQRGEAWEPSKNNALSEIMERWIERYFHLLVFEELMLQTKAGVAADRWRYTCDEYFAASFREQTYERSEGTELL